jgi:hypothetical protein
MKQLVCFLFLSLILSCFAYGYGLGSGFLENNTMLLSPGESKEYIIELQNNDLIPLKMKFFLESDIASVINQEEYYFVGNLTPIKQITLLIKVPEDATPGKEYFLKYGATPYSDSNKSINLNIQLSNSFKVVVKEPEQNNEKKESSLFPTLIIVSIGIVFIVIFAIIFRKNKIVSRKIFRK